MVDGIGTHSYNYDQFSRLTSEAQPLPDLSNQFNVGYEYNRAGQLKSVTDHFGQKASYNFDTAGRLSSVNNANNWGAGASTAVISSRAYRACTLTLDQFITQFYQGALHRAPTQPELDQWKASLGQAQAQGFAPLSRY